MDVLSLWMSCHVLFGVHKSCHVLFGVCVGRKGLGGSHKRIQRHKMIMKWRYKLLFFFSFEEDAALLGASLFLFISNLLLLCLGLKKKKNHRSCLLHGLTFIYQNLYSHTFSSLQAFIKRFYSLIVSLKVYIYIEMSNKMNLLKSMRLFVF